MLLSDSPEQCQVSPEELTDKEKELAERMQKAADNGVNALDKKGIGVITPHMPNSYYNLLCFIIAYKTGTSLTDVMKMDYFDFVSYLYIVGKFSEEGTPDGGTPEAKDMERKLGM